MTARPFQPRRRGGDDGEHWISVSDLMSGLMIIFLFVVITGMANVGIEVLTAETTGERGDHPRRPTAAVPAG